MKCWHCNDELIWGGDHDAEDDTGFIMITNLTCPTCDSYVEVHLPDKRRKDIDVVNKVEELGLI